MQSLLITGRHYSFPGDLGTLIHLFNTLESSKDSEYKETDSQLGTSEVKGEPYGTSFAEKN